MKDRAWENKIVTKIDTLLSWYQKFISPLFPPSCRFEPTCSEYTRQALKKHGLFRGGLMALWRILRCHPYSRGGYDPVP